MLVQWFHVTLYALALGAFSALLLWAVPRAYFASTPILQRMLALLDGWLQPPASAHREPRGDRQ